MRGDDSFSWIAILIPAGDAGNALEGLQNDLASLLSRGTRVLSLTDSTFQQLRAEVHQPSDDVVILTAADDLTPDKWSSVDLMRSALERKGPMILWISPDAFAGLSQFAPNVRSFVGASVFVAGPDGSLMTEEERQNRLRDLAQNYGQTDEDIIRKAQSNELPPEPHFVEWLVLLGRGDLV